MATGLDLAAGYRPATPVNKKRRTYIDEAQNILSRTGEDPDPLSEGELDASTVDFRNRRSARDRLLNLNIGKTPGGERVNPMMPGAAGMGTGPSNTNYGGQGTKTNWFINQENARNAALTGVDDREQRSRSLLGISPNDTAPTDQNTSANRIAALREIGGIGGAGRAGLTDLYAAGGIGQQATSAQRESIRNLRDYEATRKMFTRGDLNNPNSIAARINARGEQKAAERQQRMSQRANGPSQEQQLMQMAANGNPAALRMLDMVAQGNRETNVAGMEGKNRLDIAKMQFGEKPAPSEAMQRQGLMEMYGANGGEAVYGDMDEFIERGLRGGGGAIDIASGGKPDPVGSAMFGAKLSPTQSRQLQEVSAGGDEKAVFRFLQGLGLSDDEVNEAANAAMGSSFRSVTNPGGWRNALRTTVDEFWNDPAKARRRLDISRRSS